MTRLFLWERKAWIFFFFFLMGWMNISFILDAGFAGVSILYLDGISCLLFSFFLIWRYFTETKQLNRLDDFRANSNLSLLSELQIDKNVFTFEGKYMEIMHEVIREKEAELSLVNIRLLEVSDELLNWVHEVKTPLTAMQLLLDQVENSKSRERLQKEWLRIYLLLDQQLHYTRLPSIDKDNRMEEVIIRNVVVKEIRDLQIWFLEKDIGLELMNLDVIVVTDQKWFAFILRQIFTNAVKYSRAHSEVCLSVEIDIEGHVLLHVKDEGIGIGSEDLQRIFQKTYTGTAGRESAASSGMGLYLAKNAAEQLGIQILVDSNDKGTRFTLKFPIENEYVRTVGR